MRTDNDVWGGDQLSILSLHTWWYEMFFFLFVEILMFSIFPLFHVNLSAYQRFSIWNNIKDKTRFFQRPKIIYHISFHRVTNAYWPNQQVLPWIFVFQYFCVDQSWSRKNILDLCKWYFAALISLHLKTIPNTISGWYFQQQPKFCRTF